MAFDVEARIAEFREALGAQTDSELASLLGVQRSAISQWRKRGSVPERAEREVAKVKATRAVERLVERQVEDLPDTEREFCRALAVVFIARYSGEDARRLLRWAASLDEVIMAAAHLLRMRQQMTGRSLAECYERELTFRFFEQDMVETLMHAPPLLPQPTGELPQ